MTDFQLTSRQQEAAWSAVVLVSLATTGWAYSRFGFIQGFVPLLVGIFALRQLLALSTEKDSKPDLKEQYEINPEREYTGAEQIEILSEVEDEYSHKQRTWGILAGVTALVGIVAISSSVVLTLVCSVVSSYCLFRYARLRRLLKMIGTRINELSGQ